MTKVIPRVLSDRKRYGTRFPVRTTSKKMWVYCYECRIVQEAYFEVWGCEKNPRGLLCTPEKDAKHGNEIDGEITCDDDYCRPFFEEHDLPSSKKKAIEFMRNHEGVVRCLSLIHI